MRGGNDTLTSEEMEGIEERRLRAPSVGSWWSLITGLSDGDSRLTGWCSGDASGEIVEPEKGDEEGKLGSVIVVSTRIAAVVGIVSRRTQVVGQRG